MVLGTDDFLIKIDYNVASDLELIYANKYGVLSWDESYQFRRIQSVPSQGTGSRAFQGYHGQRIIQLSVDIETFDPDEYVTAKTNLETALAGSANESGGFYQSDFHLYRYANGGGGGSRWLQHCFCQSFSEKAREGQLLRGGMYSPISITIVATDPDWQTSGEGASGTVHNGPILVNVATGETAITIYNTTTGLYVARIDASGLLQIAGDSESGVGNIPAP